MMRRSGAAVLAVMGAGLLLAPVAGAATRHATVLSVNRKAHTLRVVGANHQAKTFRVKARITRKVATGAKVAFHNPADGEVREGPSPFEAVVLAALGMA